MENNRQGLLGRITRPITGLLGNPLVQGIGGALAFGANPLLGLLAVPGLQGARERNQLETAAIRGRLLQRRRESEAMAGLRELLADQTTVQAPSTRTTIQGIEGDILANIPGRRASVPTVNTQGGRQQLAGLLAQFDPGAAVGLLGSGQTNETTLVRNLRAAGIDPASDDGRDLITRSLTGGNISGQLASIQATQLQLQIERQREELARLRTEREATANDQSAQLTDFKNSVVTDIERGFEIAQLLTNLQGTVLQPGAASDVREFGVGLVGLISPENRQLSAQSERFNQIATSFGLRTIDILKGTGTISNQKFKTLLDNSLSGAKSPEANKLALADILEATLQGADKLGVAVPNRSQVEALIPQLRAATDGNRRFVFNPATGQLEPK